MLVMKLLGALDILAAVAIIMLKFGLFENLGFILAIYLIIKGLIFINNIASIFDLVSAAFLLLASIGFYFSFTWLFSIWLFQKGLFSLMSY